MKSILRRRPSPALVISCIALFMSLGGVSYGVATGFIDSREIKNNEIRSTDLRNNQIRTFDIRNNEVRGFDIRNSSVQGRDVALNTLTGDDIAEGELGKVPSAALADSATAAASVAGVTLKAFNYQGQATSGFVEVLNFGGLKLDAQCTAAGAVEVRANPAVANSAIASTLGASDADVDPGEDLAVVGGMHPAAGTIAATGSDRKVVTVQAMVTELTDGVGGTTNDCGFSGIAYSGQ